MRITFEVDERPALLARLGLQDSATDAEIAAAASTLLASEPDPTPDPNPNPPNPNPAPTPPNPAPAPDPAPAPGDPEPDNLEDDVTVVDTVAFQDLERRAGLADTLQEQERINRRDSLIESAIKVGKFGPSRRDHYAARFDTDPDSTQRAIERMKPGVVPMEARGVKVDPDDAIQSDSYPQEWVPEAAARANGTQAQPAPQTLKSRVHTEE